MFLSVFNTADSTGRIACCDSQRRNISGNYAPGSYYGSLSYCNARQNHHIGRYPHIVVNCYRAGSHYPGITPFCIIRVDYRA